MKTPPRILSALTTVLIALAPLTSAQAGTVVAWGQNGSGQTNVPADLTNVIGIAAGRLHSLALRADGTVVGWGSPLSGFTRPPAGLTNVIAIAAGFSNCLALKMDRTVTVWGTNSFGPVNFPAGLTNIVAIAGGYVESLVLRDNGELYSWGKQPGLVRVQTNVVCGSQNISQGAMHSLVLMPDGSVKAFGQNNAGQCNVPPGLKALGVCAGYDWSMAIQEDRTIAKWGNAPALPAGATNVVAIAASSSQGVILRADGTVVTWGAAAPAWLTNVIAVAAGMSHALALVGDGPPLLQAPPESAELKDHSMELVMPTQSGRVYQLEYETSTTGTNWTTLPFTPGNGTLQVLVDPQATNTMRLYRVKQW